MSRGGKRPGAGRPRRPEGPEQQQPARLAAIEGNGFIIPEPDWTLVFADELDQAVARRQWRIVAAALRNSEKLAEENEHHVKRLVDAYVLYEVALRHVGEEGAVFPRKGKKQPAYNPWWTVLKDASAMAAAAEAELTITPRRRNNGGKVQRKKPSVIGGGYLRAVPK